MSIISQPAPSTVCSPDRQTMKEMIHKNPEQQRRRAEKNLTPDSHNEYSSQNRGLVWRGEKTRGTEAV